MEWNTRINSSISCNAIIAEKQGKDKSIKTSSMEWKEIDESTQQQLLVMSINDTIHYGNYDCKDPKYGVISLETFDALSNGSSHIEREIDSVDNGNKSNERAISKHDVISSKIAGGSIRQYNKNENTPQFPMSSNTERGVDVVDNGNNRDNCTTPNYDVILSDPAVDSQ